MKNKNKQKETTRKTKQIINKVSMKGIQGGHVKYIIGPDGMPIIIE